MQFATTEAQVFRNVTIILMTAVGRTKESIASDLGCSPATVANVRQRYRCQSQHELASQDAGEYPPLPRLLPYYEAGFHFPFNFQFVKLAWQSALIGQVIDAYEGLLAGRHWPNWVVGNHDNPRVATRVGLGQARAAAMLLLTLRGTPTLYYGDELGMCDVRVPSAAAQDPWEKNVPGLGRDPARTPKRAFCS